MERNNRASFQQVIPGLFIGSRISLYSPSSLRRAHITALLAVNGLTRFPPNFHTYTISIHDDEDENISLHFPPAISFISTHKSGVLVFCDAGRSRSATIIAAYLIQTLQIDAQTALNLISAVRNINPNPGFVSQLQTWSQIQLCELCKLEKKTKWVEENEDFVVLECDQCENLMVVLKKHSMKVDKNLESRMEKSLLKHAEREMTGKKVVIDKIQRTIKDHLHFHARLERRFRL